jgi:hypothetical protein
MGKKSTKFEMKARETEILKYISEGLSRQEISEKLHRIYKCTPTAAAKQYDKLVKSMKITTVEEKEMARSIFIQRYEFLYKTAVAKNNLKTAGELIDKQSKLLGLYDKDAVKEVAPSITIHPKAKLKVVPDEAEDGKG